ncbi:MAG: HlyD family secretion protein, partial [Parvularculaceae bacterium]|nr:HlyD family secretion protein [Parvularculaceae bacterium]
KWGESAVRIAEIDAANVVIRAPVDGVVGDVTIRAGEYAAVGRRLLSVVPVRDIYVVANYKETQIRRFRPGGPATIKIDAFPGAEARGVIESVSPASGAEFSLLPAENATGNFTKIVQRVPVRIRITEAPKGVSLLPGMSVTATIDTRDIDVRDASIFAPRGQEREAGAAPPPAR